MSSSQHPIFWLENSRQRLGLVPGMGAGIASWQYKADARSIDILRPWDQASTDMYKLASFAMLPWSNRISHGGFDCEGRHYPMQCNRAGEPYPIHGDGWLQAWQLEQTAPDTVDMTLHSNCFQGNPYHYRALQRFVLRDDGMDQLVEVTHLGEHPLPYGLGQHPWFVRQPDTVLHAQVQAVWLSGKDPIPTEHTTLFPPTWNPSHGMPAVGSFIDNGFTGWNGLAHIDWPSHGLRVHMRHVESSGYCLVYRPPEGPAFCFEPITHPIDSFHMAGQPGLVTLHHGESLCMQVEWRFETI